MPAVCHQRRHLNGSKLALADKYLNLVKLTCLAMTYLQTFNKADRGINAYIYHKTFNMADRGSYACLYGDKINGDINQPSSSSSEYSAICLWKMDTGQADIWNKLSILEAALIRKYDPLADSQSNIIPKPTTGIGIPLSILTDCCCFYSTGFTDRSLCVDSFHEFQADVGQAGNSSFLNASC